MNEELQKALETISAGLTTEKDATVIAAVKTKLSEINPSTVGLDEVRNFLTTSDAGKLYVSTLTNEAVKSYKTSETYKNEFATAAETAAKAREEAVRKELNKELTPDQKALQDLQKKYAEMEATAKQKELLAHASMKLAETSILKDSKDGKIPESLTQIILSDSKEKIDANIATISALLDGYKEQIKQEALKSIGTIPANTQTDVPITTAILKGLAETAQKTGKVEDRVKYAKAKQMYESQSLNK